MDCLLEPGPPGILWYLWNLGLSWPEGKGGQRARLSLVSTGSSLWLKLSPRKHSCQGHKAKRVPEEYVVAPGNMLGAGNTEGCRPS